MKKLPLIGYGLLGLPLAMSALPVYVQIPAYYTTQLGLPLAGAGFVLFFARLIDTFQDPFLGQLIDRLREKMEAWFLFAGCLLAAAFYGLWQPPKLFLQSQNYLMIWLAAMLIIAYTAHSMLNIAYLAWGSRLSLAPSDGVERLEQTKQSEVQILHAAGWREGFGLVGVIAASLIPSFIFQSSASAISPQLSLYAISFALILLLSITALLKIAPRWIVGGSEKGVTFTAQLTNKNFRKLLPIYLLNSLSVSIPATLVLFFINDRIQAPTLAGYFLATYFFAGAIGLPIWMMISKRVGAINAWKMGMTMAILAFVGTAFAQSQDVSLFFIICALSGLAVGADLALPPVILAGVIPAHEAPSGYFGMWTLVGKLALACAGLALPFLSILGYQTGQTSASGALVVAYALLPCALKLGALALLQRYKQ